jgi:hypothetical protein
VVPSARVISTRASRAATLFDVVEERAHAGSPAIGSSITRPLAVRSAMRRRSSLAATPSMASTSSAKSPVVSSTGSASERRPAPARCMSRAITRRSVVSRESRSRRREGKGREIRAQAHPHNAPAARSTDAGCGRRTTAQHRPQLQRKSGDNFEVGIMKAHRVPTPREANNAGYIAAEAADFCPNTIQTGRVRFGGVPPSLLSRLLVEATLLRVVFAHRKDVRSGRIYFVISGGRALAHNNIGEACQFLIVR